jgi:hypothetical protein
MRFDMKSARDEFRHSRQQSGPRCPFYGFEWPAASLRLQRVGGNRCGLALDRVESCGMEEAGSDVDMQACPMAERFAHFIRSAGPVIVFVTPEHPEGLPYAAWWRSTMLQRAIEVPPQPWSSSQFVEIGAASRSED